MSEDVRIAPASRIPAWSLHGGGFWISIQSDRPDNRSVIGVPPALARRVGFLTGYRPFEDKTHWSHIVEVLHLEDVSLDVTYGIEPTGGTWCHVVVTVAGWAASGVVGNAVYEALKGEKEASDRFYPGLFGAVQAEACACWVVCSAFHPPECACDDQRSKERLRVEEARKSGDQWAVRLRDRRFDYSVSGLSTTLFYAEVERSPRRKRSRRE